MPLAPGKVLLNPQWVKEVPSRSSSWDALWAPEPTYAASSPMSHSYFASQWLSMNVLSLDQKRILVDSQQEPLIVS